MEHLKESNVVNQMNQIEAAIMELSNIRRISASAMNNQPVCGDITDIAEQTMLSSMPP